MTRDLPLALAGHDLVVVDVEGNGQQPPEIIEIAALPLGQDTKLDVANMRTWLIRPTRPITPLVTRKVHGIRNSDVADAPLWTDIADDIAAVICRRIPVAHNASVERRVLGSHLQAWRPHLVLDTLRLAKTVWPDLPGGYGMDRLITHAALGPPPEQVGLRRHRAGYDTWMTAHLLLALIQHSGLGWEHLITAAHLPDLPTHDTEEAGLW